MGQLSLSRIALVGVLLLTMAGCGGGEESVAPTPSASPSQAAQPPAPTPFAKPPVVAQQPIPNVVVPPVPGLIQPTNPQERSRVVQKGRSDPFAIIPGQSIQTVPNNVPPQRTVPSLPNLPIPGVPIRTIPAPSRTGVRPSPTKPVSPRPNPAIAKKPSPNRGNPVAQLRPGRGNLLPPVVPGNAIAPILPPAPRPDLAQAVAVTGVDQIGNETEAIVQVPNEATSRYVRVGQRLSNGQVLVKRIEMNTGSAPVVILEQYGVEVAKAVGEQPTKSGQPTAAIPTSPSS
jgi:hypothetical protein